MAATSNHIGDIGIWIEKVIESCATPLQEVSAGKLVSLFEARLIREDSKFYSYYSIKLRERLDQRFYSRLKNKTTDANTN
jgi:hypothetical protein